ncbi:hypothetical protein [Chryseobacterium sp.]|uniref:hypothetical protein n=1 Tax=Chryseobacterium sp. TaxID=1871047 RepID=UPI00321B08C5
MEKTILTAFFDNMDPFIVPSIGSYFTDPIKITRGDVYMGRRKTNGVNCALLLLLNFVDASGDVCATIAHSVEHLDGVLKSV